MKALLYTVLLFCSLSVFGNSIKPDSTAYALVNKGKTMVEEGDYEMANRYFLQCLNLGSIQPDELAFYFGKSLYNTGYPRQSEIFLLKYIDLKDTTAQNYDEALALLESLRKKPEVTKEEEDQPLEENDHTFEEGPCEGHEHVVCPVCDGAGVLKKNGKFGPIFRTCQYCDDHGLMSCEDYMKYRDGSLFEE